MVELGLFESHRIAFGQIRAPTVPVHVLPMLVVLIARALTIETMLVGKGGLHDWLVILKWIKGAL